MPTATRITITGLLVAVLGVLSINFMRGGELGFSLEVALVLLLAKAAAWRFRMTGHIVAGIVGLLLLLLFGGYTIADITGPGDSTVEYNETATLIIDGVLALAGAATVYGAVSYIVQRRRGRHAPTVGV